MLTKELLDRKIDFFEGLNTTEYYYRARYYDPNAGKFLSPDPIGFLSGDSNLYRYVGNNPVNATDPFGLTEEDVLKAFAFAQNRYGNIPKFIFAKNMGTVQGQYDEINNVIYINNNYRNKLSTSQQALLLQTVYHEVLHSKNSWMLLADSLTPNTSGRDDIFHEYIFTSGIEDAANDWFKYINSNGESCSAK